jgi:hypothetical protein
MRWLLWALRVSNLSLHIHHWSQTGDKRAPLVKTQGGGAQTETLFYSGSYPFGSIYVLKNRIIHS